MNHPIAIRTIIKIAVTMPQIATTIGVASAVMMTNRVIKTAAVPMTTMKIATVSTIRTKIVTMDRDRNVIRTNGSARAIVALRIVDEANSRKEGHRRVSETPPSI